MLEIILKGGPCDGLVERDVPATSTVYEKWSQSPSGRYLATGEVDDSGRRVFGFAPSPRLVGDTPRA